MPKLTINSVCPKGPVYPIIFNFQNGYPSEDFECKCAIIQDDKGKKTIATECGRILYVGVENTENMGQTLLLVRNRKTGKVRLLETGSADLKPIINNPNQQFTARNSERIQKLQNLETRNSEPTTSPNPQESQIQYLENVSGLSIMPNDHEETHQPTNIIVKPLQYLKTTVKGSNTNLKPQQLKKNKLKANNALNSQQETCPNNKTGRRSISYNSQPVNSNFKRRSNSEPSKKGSTTGFSPRRSGHFRHLYNFVVDEIGSIPNQQSETECNKSRKSINHSIKLITNKDANKTIESEILLSDLLKEIGTNAETEGMSFENITLTADISTDNLNEGNKHISSIDISEEIEKVTNISSENIKFTADVGTEELNKVNKILSKELKNKLEEKITIMETEELAAKKRNFTIDIDPEELQISEIIANKELRRHQEEKSSDTVTEGKEPENTKLTLVVGTEELNKSNKMTASKLLPRNMLKEKVPDLIIEAIASENKLTFDVGTEELEEANNMIANQEEESEKPLEDVKTQGITAEEISSAMDIELLIFSFDALSINTTSEFEGENNLTSKLHQEGHEEHSKWKRKNYLTKQYFVAAMRLDPKGEKKMKQNPDLPASSVGLTNGRTRTTNDSISSNHAENTYICDYCHAVFENKGVLIFHLISHKFSMESNNDVTQLNIKRILETDVDNVNERNTDCNEKSNEFKDGELKKNNNYVDIATKNVQVIDISSENTYICDYCGVMFEKKGALVLHLTSHEFVKAKNNLTQLRIKRMKGNYNDNNEELNENRHACSINNSSTTIEENENNVLKEENSEFNDDKNIIQNNQINDGQTVTEITYICNYCEAVFENKGSLIFHLRSHEFIKDTDNIRKTKIKRVKENDNDDNGNKSSCSENYGNTQKQEKIKPGLNEKSKELEDAVNKKRKITGTTHKTTKKEFKNNEHGKRTKAANSVTGMGNGTLKVTQDGAIKLINCKHCDYKTDDTSNILKHVLSHTRDNSNQCDPIYICNDCGKEFKSKASLIIHKNNKNKSNRNKRIRNLCVTCNSSFTTQSDLINHLTKSHKITKPYRCGLCDFKSSSAHELTIHTQTHKTKPFRCAICKYQCHKDNFVKHMQSHTDTKPFECELCDSKFAKKSGLKQHMVTHTREKGHKCKICDSKFSLLSGLNRHSLIHLKEKPFKCATCSAGFNDKSALKRHQKIHTGEKPYKCAHCEYSCITGNDLKRHIKTHDSKLKQDSSNLKHDSDITEPYQCTRCNSKFSLKNTLICHMKIHTGEKTHKCTFCDKTFIHFSGLKRHLNVHTKNKPVKCTTCNTSYDNETALKWHLRRSKKHQ